MLDSFSDLSDKADVAPLSVEELITANVALVGFAVSEIGMRLPAHVDREDLRSAGLMGLVQAAQSYDAERGVPFRHYASTRIRGAIMDELRSHDWASRSVRQAGRNRDQAVETLTASLGRTPSPREIAEVMGVSMKDLHTVDSALHRSTVLSFDAAPTTEFFEAAIPEKHDSPEDGLVRSEEFEYLKAAVAALPERLRAVVTGYFLEGRPMAEIADELGITESRVSQIRAEALVLLRDGLNAHLAPELVSVATRPGGVVERRRAAYFAQIAQERLLTLADTRSVKATTSREAASRVDGVA
jgi:RNA polymerase sigma factor for flagellar operon FliA